MTEENQFPEKIKPLKARMRANMDAGTWFLRLYFLSV